jgi:hypothetical protein
MAGYAILANPNSLMDCVMVCDNSSLVIGFLRVFLESSLSACLQNILQ